MKPEPMAPRPPLPALAPAARLAASHDALAQYLRGGARPAVPGALSGLNGLNGLNGLGGPDGPGTRDAGTPGTAGDTEDPPAAATAHHTNFACALAHKALAPVAREHPWALVGGAVAVGALIASRPWRNTLQPLLLAGLVSPVLTRWAARAVVQSLAHRLLGPDPDRPR